MACGHRPEARSTQTSIRAFTGNLPGAPLSRVTKPPPRSTGWKPACGWPQMPILCIIRCWGGALINIVAVINEKFKRTGLVEPWTKARAARPTMIAGTKAPRDFLKSVPGWQKWALYSLPPLPQLEQGSCHLVGDAAHPPIPFLAQGGVMAIEDAYVLAKQLDHYGEDYASAFAQYESSTPRTRLPGDEHGPQAWQNLSYERS